MKKLAMLAVLGCSAIAGAVPAVAADSSPVPGCPKGQLLLVRTMKITGTREGLLRAVEDNNRWHQGKGTRRGHPHIAATVVIPNPRTHTFDPKPDMFATVQIDPTNTPAELQDDAWRAFVSSYESNAAFGEEMLLCLDKPLK